jgi:hypothetical protein
LVQSIEKIFVIRFWDFSSSLFSVKYFTHLLIIDLWKNTFRMFIFFSLCHLEFLILIRMSEKQDKKTQHFFVDSKTEQSQSKIIRSFVYVFTRTQAHTLTYECKPTKRDREVYALHSDVTMNIWDTYFFSELICFCLQGNLFRRNQTKTTSFHKIDGCYESALLKCQNSLLVNKKRLRRYKITLFRKFFQGCFEKQQMMTNYLSLHQQQRL